MVALEFFGGIEGAKCISYGEKNPKSCQKMADFCYFILLMREGAGSGGRASDRVEGANALHA